MFKNHPKGLPILFFAEMWERFGFYLMLGIFVLYMTATDGLNKSTTEASDIYGTYIALVYLTPFLGGLLADRILGYIKSIIIGGILMGIGYFMLAVPGETLFWPALFFVIFGNGFFKPNISTLVGNLYSKKEYVDLKDSGYNIFYMGINIGAFICNFIAAYMRNEFGWGYAFAAAGVGMFIGVGWFILGIPKIKEADVKKPAQKEDASFTQLFIQVFIPAIVFALIGYFGPNAVLGHSLFSPSTDAFLFASIPIVFYYFSLWVRASKEDKGPIAALLSIFAVVIVFWAIFHQNGAALTIWARDYTGRELPSSVESVAGALNLTESVSKYELAVKDPTTGKVEAEFPVLYIKPGASDDGKIYYKLSSTDKQYSSVDTTGKTVTKELTEYFRVYDKEKLASVPDDREIKLLSTELFQSINPFFVVFLTPVVVGFWAFTRRKKKEPSTPGKIGLGLFITALSTTVMMLAVVFSGNATDKSSAMWLVGTYFVVTIGELCLSPMGLSLVSKLSPQRLTALMMGGWFLSTSIGNKLSGVLSGLWDTYDNKVYFFLVNFIGAFIAAALIFLMLKWLKRVMAEHMKS